MPRSGNPVVAKDISSMRTEAECPPAASTCWRAFTSLNKFYSTRGFPPPKAPVWSQQQG